VTSVGEAVDAATAMSARRAGTSRWRVTRAGAAQACAEVAVSLSRLGAAAEDRAHAVAALWDTLRRRRRTARADTR
jgi:hypothetical protein